MDNEIIELHPPLVTFASIDYDGEPTAGAQNPPPPAPYDHKNLVVVNRNDLESILVSKGAVSGTTSGVSGIPQPSGISGITQPMGIPGTSGIPTAQSLKKQAPSNGYLRVSKPSHKECLK